MPCVMARTWSRLANFLSNNVIGAALVFLGMLVGRLR